MATHHIYAKIDADIEVVRTALVDAFHEFSWPYTQASENYFKMEASINHVHEQTHIIPGIQYEKHGISAIHQLNTHISSGMMSVLKKAKSKFSFLEKSSEYINKFQKTMLDHDVLNELTGAYGMELILFPDDEHTEFTLTIKSIEKKSSYLILMYLVLHEHLGKKNRISFSSYEYEREKSANKKVQSKQTSQHQEELTAPSPDKNPVNSPISKERPAAPPSKETQKNLEEYISQIKINLSDNKIKDCFKELDALFERMEENPYEEYLILQAEFNRMTREIIAGILSFEEARLQRNQINHRFLQLLNLMREDEDLVPYIR